MSPVEWVCFLTPSGYSQAAQDYIRALHGSYDLRVKVLHGEPTFEGFSQASQTFFRTLMARPPHADAVQVYHCTPQLQRRVGRLRRSVGFATFETLNPPNLWIDILNQNEAVIVPSQFCRDAFQSAGVVKPLFHIPHCIDTTLFNETVVASPPPCLHPFEGHFRFLFFGSWNKRKGWPQLLEAFWKEFDPSDRVVLTLKTDHRQAAEEDIRSLRSELGLSGKEVPPVLLETRVFDELGLPGFLKSHDCLVFPTLGEGFGLPPLQCMALGVPVIATNHSGCRDYLSDETATLIEPEGYLIHRMLDGIQQFTDRPWAFVPVRRLREAMRRAVQNVDEIKGKARVAAARVAAEYSYSVTATRFKAVADHVGA